MSTSAMKAFITAHLLADDQNLEPVLRQETTELGDASSVECVDVEPGQKLAAAIEFRQDFPLAKGQCARMDFFADGVKLAQRCLTAGDLAKEAPKPTKFTLTKGVVHMRLEGGQKSWQRLDPIIVGDLSSMTTGDKIDLDKEEERELSLVRLEIRRCLHSKKPDRKANVQKYFTTRIGGKLSEDLPDSITQQRFINMASSVRTVAPILNSCTPVTDETAVHIWRLCSEDQFLESDNTKAVNATEDDNAEKTSHTSRATGTDRDDAFQVREADVDTSVFSQRKEAKQKEARARQEAKRKEIENATVIVSSAEPSPPASGQSILAHSVKPETQETGKSTLEPQIIPSIEKKQGNTTPSSTDDVGAKGRSEHPSGTPAIVDLGSSEHGTQGEDGVPPSHAQATTGLPLTGQNPLGTGHKSGLTSNMQTPERLATHTKIFGSVEESNTGEDMSLADEYMEILIEKKKAAEYNLNTLNMVADKSDDYVRLNTLARSDRLVVVEARNELKAAVIAIIKERKRKREAVEGADLANDVSRLGTAERRKQRLRTRGV